FCHVGKALLVDARIELEINQQTWHLHKLLYTPIQFGTILDSNGIMFGSQDMVDKLSGASIGFGIGGGLGGGISISLREE
ncbi:MAG: hypothetical protein ACFNLS_05090, partial [Lancefieldella sp.]